MNFVDVSGFPYYIITACFDFGDKGCPFVVLFDGHAIAYRDGVGAAYSLQAEFAFYLAWYGCAVFSAYFIPASRVFDDDSFQLL